MSRNRDSSMCDCGYELQLRNATTRPMNFEEYMKAIKWKGDKKLAFIVATALTQTLTELRRDGIPVKNITDEKFLDIFTLLRKKKIVPDAIPILFIYFAFNPDAKIKGAVAYTGTAAMKKSAIKKVVKRVVAEQSEYIESRGEKAVNGLMGIAMKELRGKADGKLVRDLLLKEVQNIVNKGE